MIDKKEFLWQNRIGKFCIIDYQSSNGLQAAIGELIGVLDGKLVLKNLNTGEESEIGIDRIVNSKVRNKKVGNHDSP